MTISRDQDVARYSQDYGDLDSFESASEAASTASPSSSPVSARARKVAGALQQRPLTLVTTVEIGLGRTATVELREGDSPSEVAFAFCKEYGIPEAVVAPLAQHLEENLAQQTPLSTPQPSSKHNAHTAASVSSHQRKGAPPILNDSISDSAMPKAGRAPRQARGCSVESRKSPGTGPYLYQASQSDRPQSARGHSEDSSVYERLYERAKYIKDKHQEMRRQRDEEVEKDLQISHNSITWVSRKMTEGRDTGDFNNYGERLYTEGLKDLEKKRSLAAQHKEAQEQAELKGVTWQPRISKMARDLKRESSSKPWTRLNKVSTNQKRERMLQIKREQEDAEQQECTFRPKINHHSERLVSERAETLKENHLTAHEQLYQDATRRQMRQHKLASSLPDAYTFRPQIIHDPDRDDAASDASQRPVSERLHELRKKRDARAAAAKWQQENPSDPVTGLPLFQPQTGRAPAYHRHSANQGVGEYLYSNWMHQTAKKALKSALAAEKKDNTATESHTTGRSQTLFSRLKAKRFRQIFDYLIAAQGATALDLMRLVAEPDGGLLDTLDPEVRTDVENAARILARRVAVQSSPGAELISPLTERLSDGGNAAVGPTAVGLKTFCELMEEALSLSRGVPRSYLLPVSSKPTVQVPTFLPKIDPRSKVLAERLRPKSQPLHEILHRQASIIQNRHYQKAQEQEEAALRECTFNPDLTAGRMVEQMRAAKLARLARRRAASKRSMQGAADSELEDFEELEREVRKALEEGDLLGLPSEFDDPMADLARVVANGGSQAGTDNGLGNELGEDSGNEAGYDRKRSQVPRIERWTSEKDLLVAELCTRPQLELRSVLL